MQNFARDFPSEPRVAEVESMVMKMRYRFAKELWDTAQFYERRKKTESALIYYRNIIAKYPSSHLARKAKRRLLELRPKFSHLAELFMDENDSPLIQEGVASVEEVAARDDEEPQAGDSNEDEPARDE
ncbi:MAG: hypothetical protein S4CHLAM102_13040 [Chlamydiia bacterium]|nr:hypothetical protein [Chlamydiia bacterium]